MDAVQNFRNDGIGTSNLNYGAAYAPYLETVLDFAFDKTKIVVKRTTDGVAAAGKKLADIEATDNQLYERAKAAIADLPLIMPPSAGDGRHLRRGRQRSRRVEGARQRVGQRGDQADASSSPTSSRTT